MTLALLILALRNGELDVINAIKSKEIQFEKYSISHELQQLLGHMLQKDVAKRIQINEIPHTAWYKLRERETIVSPQDLENDDHFVVKKDHGQSLRRADSSLIQLNDLAAHFPKDREGPETVILSGPSRARK